MSVQIPPHGSAKKQTVIADFKIEDGSVTISGGEQGTYNFIYQHKKIPATCFYTLQGVISPHINAYMTFITNIGQYATGSLNITGGTTAASLDGTTITLISKDAVSQVFTFNNSNDTVTGGSIGLLSDTTTENIANSIKSAVNNVTAVEITAGTITPVGGVDSDHSIELFQQITGSDGNTTIDTSAPSALIGADNFADGNDYGKVSFKTNEAFSGDVKLRAASLQNDYLM